MLDVFFCTGEILIFNTRTTTTTRKFKRFLILYTQTFLCTESTGVGVG